MISVNTGLLALMVVCATAVVIVVIVAHVMKREPEGPVRKAFPMDDTSSPFAVCGHCGAVWDQWHEEGHCGVADATRRMLENYEPRRPR